MSMYIVKGKGPLEPHKTEDFKSTYARYAVMANEDLRNKHNKRDDWFMVVVHCGWSIRDCCNFVELCYENQRRKFASNNMCNRVSEEEALEIFQKIYNELSFLREKTTRHDMVCLSAKYNLHDVTV